MKGPSTNLESCNRFPWKDGSLEEPGREIELGQKVVCLFVFLRKMNKKKNMEEPLSAENVRWGWRNWGWRDRWGEVRVDPNQWDPKF